MAFFKDVLVHMDETPRADMRSHIAMELARRHHAHLTGITIIDPPDREIFYGAGMPFALGGLEQTIAVAREDAMAAARAGAAKFRDKLRQENLTGEWLTVEGETISLMTLHARHADLTIFGQTNPDESFGQALNSAMVANVLLASGRPVLMIPYAGTFGTLGEKVLIAWNASREAARAVNDALPLLRMAKSVTVLAINPDADAMERGEIPAADIALHLARHGVKCEASHIFVQDMAAGEALLSHAADMGADLIVAGGYGHSRAREMIFGGVTRTLLRDMTVPVLLSH